MWSSAHERLTWEVGTFDLRPSQKRTSSLSKLSQVKLVESKSARCAGGAMGSAQYFKVVKYHARKWAHSMAHHASLISVLLYRRGRPDFHL